MMWSVDPLVLTVDERDELERRVRAQTASHRDRPRSQVVLLGADGVPGRLISGKVGLSDQAVCKWWRRFLDAGIEGLDDAPRSGRPLVYGSTERLISMAKVTHHTPAHASWLNQVKAFFSVLTRNVLRRGEFDSQEDLVAKMQAFVEHHSETATSFKWVCDAKIPT